MKFLFALPGFHRYDRGAEVALLSVAEALADGGDDVTVMGSGEARSGKPYRFVHVPAVPRERFESFPSFPPLRNETAWEDATFAAGLLRAYDPGDYDAAITCSFPFTHWALRRPAARKPLQVFVTQNGDWPAFSEKSEYRTFACDALVCTNPDYLERNHAKWACALIPNGVNLARFVPGPSERERLGLPPDGAIVLMVSAFIHTKRVLDGIRAVAEIEGAHLVVAGDGPLREQAKVLANELLSGRFHRVSFPASEMPALYRSADVFLHMSLLESFGNVFLEAWANGLPIVAHDTERLRWIVGDEAPFLCDTQDAEALRTTLRAAIAAGITKPNEGLQRFAWPAIASQYRTFISEMLRKRLIR